MKRILHLSLVLLSINAAAQQFTVKEILERKTQIDGPDGTDKDTVYTFPVFESATKPAVAAKINLYLQLMELNLVIGHQKHSPFENGDANNGYHYTVNANDNHNLTVSFTGQSCVMQCVTTTNAYSFDPQTGNLVSENVGFSEDRVARVNGSVLNCVLRGKIADKYPISIVLHPGYANEASNVIRGVEVYDNVGIGIPLEGTMNGNKITLHEVNVLTPDKPVSDMELVWDGNSLTGTFKNVKNNNLLSFRVSDHQNDR